jgi:SGNH hydrolase-like domain, acetyltransferase AlgX
VSTAHYPPDTNARRRVFWGLAVLIVTALLWMALALLSRDVLPGAEAWINPLLGITLIATYAGVWISAIVASRNPRYMLLRALAATVAVLAMLAIVELPAMLRWVHWTLIFRSLSGEGVDYGSAFVRDEALVFRRIPGLRWSGRPASDIENAYGLPRSLRQTLTFTYDRWGYRNASEKEEADVVLLGDSYVEGWYVSDEQTVAAQLAARLGRPVANLGVAGYGTLQELRVLKGDALRRHPKVVAWFFFEGNDLYNDQTFENNLLARPPSREDATPHAEGLTRDHGWVRRSFVLNSFQRIRRWIHPLIPNRAPYWARLPGPGRRAQRVYFFDYGAVPWTGYEEKRWAIARATFEEGLAFARERGIDLVFLYVPTKYRVFRDFIEIPQGSPMERWDVWHLLPVRFQDFCMSAVVPCVDLTNRLRQAVAQGRMPYPANDTHWSPDGHAIAAAAVEDVLRERGWIASQLRTACR